MMFQGMYHISYQDVYRFREKICDPSRKKGAYPNFTLWLFHGPGREIVKNYWNVSEISLSRHEKGHSHRENISRRENRS